MRLSRLSPLLLILAAGVPALAQGTQTSTITMEVVDAKGQPVAGALVRVTSPALQGERQGRTDTAGRYRAPLLPPGDYRLVINKDGMESVTMNQHLGLEQTFSPRVVMKETSGATVEVVTTSVAADKSEFKSAQSYTKEEIDALPVNRTSLLDIAYLSPGVVENQNSDRGEVQIRGSMGTGNVFLVDGQNINDNLYQGQRIGIIFDSVDETLVLTGALPAEYGDVEGGVVNSVTKSGSDQFEGSIRWDLANPSWNAVTPRSDRSAYDSNLSSQRSIQLGGPLIKGRLWFHVGYFDTHPHEVKSIVADQYYNSVTDTPYTGTGYTYQAPTDDYRREYKLTAALSDNHNLSAAYHNYRSSALKDYGAGEPVALTTLVQIGRFWNVALRSIWAPWFTTSLRYGEKHQELPSQGGDTGQWLINNDDTANYLAYRNTYFNPNDPAPDQRDNKTANFKGTFFVEALGSHQIDVGFDYYQGTTVASGDGSPTTIYGPAGTPVAGRRLNLAWVDAYNVDPVAQTSGVYDAYFYEWIVDKATSSTQGYYVNDKWALNQNWIFQIGGRFDGYDYKSQAVGKVASHSSFSPRLGAKWDLFGDSAWVAGASYAKYNGRVLEGTLTNATYVNTPRYYAFNWGASAPARASNADLANLANWDFSSVIDYGDSGLTNKFDPNLKPQTVEEKQLTLTWTFKNARIGSGYVKGTLVAKDWGNLIDYRSGNDGHVTDPVYGQNFYVRYYYNNPDAVRKYRAFELESSLTRGAWNLSGYISWSSLRGNFEGEARANPGKGQGMYNFSNVDGVQMYDPAVFAPYGYLPGHVPIRMRWTAMYSTTNFLGKQSFGLLYHFDSGLHYSITRSVSTTAINPGLPGQFGYHATQYLGERGTGVFPSVSLLDLSFQEDVQLWSMGGDRHATGFVKIDVGNILNHQQMQSFYTNYQGVDSTGSLNDPWVQDTGYGTATDPSNFAQGRTIRIGCGVKF